MENMGNTFERTCHLTTATRCDDVIAALVRRLGNGPHELVEGFFGSYGELKQLAQALRGLLGFLPLVHLPKSGCLAVDEVGIPRLAPHDTLTSRAVDLVEHITIWVDFQEAIPVFCARSSLPVPLGTLDSAQTISPVRPGQY